MTAGCAAAWAAMKSAAAVADRITDAAAFNKQHRWRKRGVYCMPVQYEVNTSEYSEGVTVSVAGDGSITVDHSGIEMGQGINTKVPSRWPSSYL